MDIPKYLKHKPILCIKDYSSVDGDYKDNTDVEGMTIGKAQWLDDEKFVPSIKIWRHTGKRWSRQSEETTLTRALDMATFIVKTIDDRVNNKKENKLSICGKKFLVDEMGNTVEFDKYIKDKKDMLLRHIESLRKTLNGLKWS